MWATFSKVAATSHASLALIIAKKQGYESLSSFIYRWGELLQSCDISAEKFKDKQKKVASPSKY